MFQLSAQLVCSQLGVSKFLLSKMITVDATSPSLQALLLQFDTEFSFGVAANDIPQGACVVFTLWSVDSMVFADKNGCLVDGILFK